MIVVIGLVAHFTLNTWINSYPIKLLEFFVYGIIIRVVTDLLEIRHNLATLFFTKAYKVIAYYLVIEVLEILLESSEKNSTKI